MAYVGGAYLKPAAEYDAEDADDSASTVASSKNIEAAVTKGKKTGLTPETQLIISLWVIHVINKLHFRSKS